MEAATRIPRKQRKAFRKREYVKYVKFLRKQLRRRNGIEVRPARQWEGYLQHKHVGASHAQKAEAMASMQADAFWKNYATAYEWQNRHSVIWWRSRCTALEQENEILRNKVRSLARSSRSSNAKKNSGKYSDKTDRTNGGAQEVVIGNSDENENLELNVTEEMLDFLETSERHRRERQMRRRSEENASRKTVKKQMQESIIVNIPEIVHANRERAKLLYGDAAPKILAMEAALQVTATRYKDLTNAKHWPNIPFKP